MFRKKSTNIFEYCALLAIFMITLGGNSCEQSKDEETSQKQYVRGKRG
jgi:hypothetical protein